MTMDWGSDDVFISNNGRGPLRARILCIADGVATMERWGRGMRRTRFTLPERYLESPRCGWVLANGIADAMADQWGNPWPVADAEKGEA